MKIFLIVILAVLVGQSIWAALTKQPAPEPEPEPEPADDDGKPLNTTAGDSAAP